jgi:hypothetical protein
MPRLSPSTTSETDTLLDELLEEIAQKLRSGDAIDVEKYAHEHPHLAEPLHRLLPGIEALVDLGHSAEPSHSAFRTPHSALAGTLGDFRIVRELGRGGMGVVYEAEQISLCRRVAVKVLPFAAVLDKRHLARFENEARAAATLEHPHIVPVYGVGEERGIHYYAMRLIRGQSLAEAILGMRSAECGIRNDGGMRSDEGAASENSELRIPHSRLCPSPPSRRSTLAIPAPTSALSPRSALKLPAPCTTPTSGASCTVTSSPRTSCSTTRARLGSPTSASPGSRAA